MELAIADVERADARRARLEKAVGEAAGRGSDVQAVLSLDVDGEGRERVGELLAAARDEARAGLDLDLRRLVHLLAGLCMAGHLSGEDECLRLRARLGEPALDHEDIEPLLGHVGSVTSALRRNRQGGAYPVMLPASRSRAPSAARTQEAPVTELPGRPRMRAAHA